MKKQYLTPEQLSISSLTLLMYNNHRMALTIVALMGIKVFLLSLVE